MDKHTNAENLLSGQIEKFTEAKIKIHFISEYVGYGGGHFALSNVQQLKTTRDFDKLKEIARGCTLQDEQRNEREKSSPSCPCIPYIISEVVAWKV